MVEVTVAKLGVDSSTNSYVVILQERDGSRILPIWIGQPEAESIVMHMNNIKRERPLTHDLCKSLIVGLGGSLRRVQITKVQKNTYFAELHIQRGEEIVQIDARPSDSIAVALRLSAPIFAQESLLTVVADEEDSDEAIPGSPSSGLPSPADPDALSTEQLKEHLERMRPEDFGKFNL
ncbi:MAG TPA: bifunctional nuclease family protein [Gemmatimonadaceae bacterium]|nr:bifunctional nuclease family protein [Gemmatimonadaceae bacterium]